MLSCGTKKIIVSSRRVPASDLDVELRVVWSREQESIRQLPERLLETKS